MKLRFHRERECQFGRSPNYVILQQTVEFETQGSPYVMGVVDEKPQDTCRDVNKQVGVLILLSCSSLPELAVDSPSLECGETTIFVSKFSDNIQFELVFLVA